MPKIFTTVEGSEIAIGTYGQASKTIGVDVPADVAAQLAGRSDLRVERAEAQGYLPAQEPKPFTQYRRGNRR